MKSTPSVIKMAVSKQGTLLTPMWCGHRKLCMCFLCVYNTCPSWDKGWREGWEIRICKARCLVHCWLFNRLTFKNCEVSQMPLFSSSVIGSSYRSQWLICSIPWLLEVHRHSTELSGPGCWQWNPPPARSQQMVSHTVLCLLTFSPGLIDNTKCWCFKHSISLFAVVISVNSSYSKKLCSVKLNWLVN